jgi:hypothetical protein
MSLVHRGTGQDPNHEREASPSESMPLICAQDLHDTLGFVKFQHLVMEQSGNSETMFRA